jgi:hypothetical protein
MNAPKFTPGPWRAIAGRGGHGRVLVFTDEDEGERFIVAEVSLDTDDPTNAVALADARLIAAAPDLYEALRTCRAELRNYERTELGGPNPSALAAIDEANVALAKAEGR